MESKVELLKFDSWAIVEVMGHQTYAGRVSEETIGGTAFIRVDVPAVGEIGPFTKLLGGGSIYAITLVSEEVARMRAEKLRKAPLDVWDLPEEVRSAIHRGRSMPALPSPDEAEDSLPDDDEDFGQ